MDPADLDALWSQPKKDAAAAVAARNHSDPGINAGGSSAIQRLGSSPLAGSPLGSQHGAPAAKPLEWRPESAAAGSDAEDSAAERTASGSSAGLPFSSDDEQHERPGTNSSVGGRSPVAAPGGQLVTGAGAFRGSQAKGGLAGGPLQLQQGGGSSAQHRTHPASPLSGGQHHLPPRAPGADAASSHAAGTGGLPALGSRSMPPRVGGRGEPAGAAAPKPPTASPGVKAPAKPAEHHAPGVSSMLLALPAGVCAACALKFTNLSREICHVKSNLSPMLAVRIHARFLPPAGAGGELGRGAGAGGGGGQHAHHTRGVRPAARALLP